MNEKVKKILEQLAYGNFIAEDMSSVDYCIYCNRTYGNYERFGFIQKSVEDNHEEDCLHRMAWELLKEESNGTLADC
jgi:hypothetical protein